jgi:AcrR family transcriptional regulator
VTAVVADKPSTRDRILVAALDAFAARGVEATSLDAVAAELGIRKQTILYWFPSKEQLLLAVIDLAVAELGETLTTAALAARPTTRSPTLERQTRMVAGASLAAVLAPTLADRLTAVVDATFRLGTIRPQLLAVLREIARLGPPATTHLATAVEPLVGAAALALGRPDALDQVRSVLLAAGARVVGLTTEAEVRADLGLAPDLAWLRRSRHDLLALLVGALDAR